MSGIEFNFKARRAEICRTGLHAGEMADAFLKRRGAIGAVHAGDAKMQSFHNKLICEIFGRFARTKRCCLWFIFT